jgi:hypothetical protein
MSPTGDDVLDGSAPIDFDRISRHDAQRVTVALSVDDADRWGAWFLSSGLVDPDRIARSGLDALDAIWAGVLEALDRSWFGSDRWDDLVEAGPVPIWCRLRPSSVTTFGVTGCWVAAGAIALTSAWIQREWDGSWVLPPDERGLDRAVPGSAIPDSRGFLPQVQVVGAISAAVGVFEPPDRDPSSLRTLMLRYEPTGQPSTDDDGPDLVGPGVSSTAEDARWLIGFPDMQGHEESDRIDRFVDSIAAAPDVGRAHREDRELVVVVVDSPIGAERLQALADAAWAATHG